MTCGGVGTLGQMSGGAGSTDCLQLAPRQTIGSPDLLEGSVGGVGETVAIAEVVHPPLLVHFQAQPAEAAGAVGLPRGHLAQSQILVGRLIVPFSLFKMQAQPSH